MQLTLRKMFQWTRQELLTLSSNISSMRGVRLTHMKPVPNSSISVYMSLVVVDSKEVGQHLQQNLQPILPKQHSSCISQSRHEWTLLEWSKRTWIQFVGSYLRAAAALFGHDGIGFSTRWFTHSINSIEANSFTRVLVREWLKKNDDKVMCLFCAEVSARNPGAAC